MKIYQKTNNEWTKWFSWFPIKTEREEIVWLEFVYRKKFYPIIDNVYPSEWTIYKRI